MIGRILHALGLERRVTDYNPAFAPDTWGRAFHPGSGLVSATRSEERRVGKECRSRWSPYH